MKRLKYKFPKYIKKQKKNQEIKRAATLYLLNQKIWTHFSFQFHMKNYNKKNFNDSTRLNVYCIVTGRVHYTVKNFNISRQVFFEYIRVGALPGFFFSS